MDQPFRQDQQGRSVPLPLEIRPDSDQAEPCPEMVEKVDPDRADHLVAMDQHMRKIAGLEFIWVLLVIDLSCKVKAKDRIPPYRMIRYPILGGLGRPQNMPSVVVAHHDTSRLGLPVGERRRAVPPR